MTEEQGEKKKAKVRDVHGWKVVECGTWEISVAPDGMLMLPRSLQPSEVEDFVTAATAAAEVGTQMIASYSAPQGIASFAAVAPEATEAPIAPRSAGGAYVTTRNVPEGLVKMAVGRKSGIPVSTIGRPSTLRDVRQPRSAPQPGPPIPRGTR